MADAILLTFLQTDEITHYPAVYVADNSGDAGTRTYPTGTNHDALVQFTTGQRINTQGVVGSYTIYNVYLSSDIGAIPDDKIVWNRGSGKNLFVTGTADDMGGIDDAYVLTCEERT